MKLSNVSPMKAGRPLPQCDVSELLRSGRERPFRGKARGFWSDFYMNWVLLSRQELYIAVQAFGGTISHRRIAMA